MLWAKTSEPMLLTLPAKSRRVSSSFWKRDLNSFRPALLLRIIPMNKSMCRKSPRKVGAGWFATWDFSSWGAKTTFLRSRPIQANWQRIDRLSFRPLGRLGHSNIMDLPLHTIRVCIWWKGIRSNSTPVKNSSLIAIHCLVKNMPRSLQWIVSVGQ